MTIQKYTPQEILPPDDICKSWDTALARPNQPLSQHMHNVSTHAAAFGKKCDISEMAGVAGFFHDLGKLSDAFQAKLDGNQDQVPHSIFGAKRVFADMEMLPHIAEILSNSIMAHHGALYDNLSPNGDTPILDRLAIVRLFPLFPSARTVQVDTLKKEFDALIKKIHPDDIGFAISMLTKLVYSCLVDADRLDAYLHESKQPLHQHVTDWDKMLSKLMARLANFTYETDIALFRKRISDSCGESGLRERGVYKLEVPTGGGKTLASLRFALVHAKKHKFDRIIFVIPYLSILSQTAEEIRKALEEDEAIVLEHHSGFLPDKPEFYKLQTDRWDAPIILTTQVQFLESVFSAKGSDLRKLHSMANSVIIFDEAQNLPVKCVHIFNGAINFLSSVCGTTVLLCTATQPLLDKVKRKLRLSQNPSIAECGTLAKRTNIEYAITQAGYSYPELADFVMDKHNTSTLVIVNTKAAAKALYDELKEIKTPVLHLSTNMCAAHRDDVFAQLRYKLDTKAPVICISTQLIEAGVDISFECVIRAVAGLDSIFQAAGRCNRHGEFGEAKDVFVINIAGENLTKLPDIKIGAEITRRLCDEGRGEDIDAYYHYYFHERRNIMDYPTGDNGTIYDLLSANNQGCNAFRNSGNKKKAPATRAALRSAADAFFVIDRGRKDVIVPYGEALELVAQYSNSYDLSEKRKLLRLLGKYSVSLYQYQEDILKNANALYMQDELTIVAAGFYDPVRGIDLEGKQEFLIL